jgi:hypothetical protein
MPPTAEHEALHRVFHRDEALFARAMARVFNVQVPAPEPGGVTVLSTDLTEIQPLERRADSVLQAEFLVEDATGKYILVIESQTDVERDRLRRWPHFIAHLHDKHDCPVLAVVCSKQSTARWARQPIDIGMPGLILQTTRLVVFGPDNVPTVTNPEEAAADAMLAVFSALTHSRGTEARGILEALASALATIDEETASSLSEFTEIGLGETPSAEIWKAMMATRTYPFVSQTRLQGREEGRAKGLAEGRVEGRAQGLAAAIFKVFDRRGIKVDDDSRERIESCTDADKLEAWLDQSFAVAKASDLFA